MRSRILILMISLALIIAGCKKSDPGGTGTVTGTGGGAPDVITPGKSSLLFPAQNSVCVAGTSLSATQNQVTLTWTPSTNTDSYDLNIKNLITGVVATTTVFNATATLTLDNGMPYSWFVMSKTSKNAAVTTPSDTWKFYVAGTGILYYAPFPATIVSPVFNQSVNSNAGTINLSWTGSDPDNDIVGYDVYLGVTTTPGVYKSNINTMFLNNVAILPATTYYWKVITKDIKGNTSDSGIYQFKVL